jgi:putative endonuclease
MKVNRTAQTKADVAGTPGAWTVYMLRCADGSLYTGIARDVQRRLHEHNHCNRLGARYTRGRRPVRLVFQCAMHSRGAAAAREAAIKRLSRAEKEALIARSEVQNAATADARPFFC